MTVMSMKSFGPNFVNTTLQVSVEVVRSANVTTAAYTIDGYHEPKTSIHVPHKFRLPGEGAKKGDKIIATATLLSGAYFKINGLAFCVS